MITNSETPFTMSPDEQERLTKVHADRTKAATNINTYNLPELPETSAQQIYERLIEAERMLAAPTLQEEDYDAGVARFDDEMRINDGSGAVLLTTEHATSQQRHYRTGVRRKGPEFGLAALGAIVGEDTGISHMTMLGRQTGDPNNDPHHPFKDEITRILNQDMQKRMFVSLHGMVAGHVATLEDARSIDVSVGIGNTPTDQSAAKADRLVAAARDLGLRAGINEPFISFARKDPIEPNLREDGSIKMIRFGGGGNTTRQHAENVGDDRLAALQVEYSSFLRLTTPENNRDYKSRYMGAYIGYLLLKQTVEINV